MRSTTRTARRDRKSMITPSELTWLPPRAVLRSKAVSGSSSIIKISWSFMTCDKIVARRDDHPRRGGPKRCLRSHPPVAATASPPTTGVKLEAHWPGIANLDLGRTGLYQSRDSASPLAHVKPSSPPMTMVRRSAPRFWTANNTSTSAFARGYNTADSLPIGWSIRHMQQALHTRLPHVAIRIRINVNAQNVNPGRHQLPLLVIGHPVEHVFPCH